MVHNASTTEAINAAANAAGVNADELCASAVARAAATEPLPHSKLMQLTADAVNARNAAAAAFAAESGVLVTEAAPFMGGWSFFAHCVQGGEDKGAAVMAAIRRLGFVAARHEVNDRHNRGATFYAKPE